MLGGWIANAEVRPSVLPIAVDRIQWNFEPMREAAENCFEFIGSGGGELGAV